MILRDYRHRLAALLAACLLVQASNSLSDTLPVSAHTETLKTEDIIVSPNDARQYRHLTLPNKLDVILISDPDTAKAAAAMNVAVGSAADPDDRQGLAHFLEHMLFLGTERYPDPAEYQTFINAHSGSHNAYTATDHTNYFFDVDADSLEASLDRFSQFFTAPLFNQEYVDRERHAVHSEYLARYKDDGRRQYDVLSELVSKHHPLAHFSVGSLDYLVDQEGDSVRDALITFYQQHYSSDQMTLVVIGKESLGQLQAWVSEKFAHIPRRETAGEKRPPPLFNDDFLPARVFIQSEKDLRQLTLMFPVPSAEAYVEEKPLQYLGHMLGHEGPGSLLEVLKSTGWAEALAAGESYSGDGQSAFSITISLTPEGLQEQKKVAGLVFKYIQMVKDEGVEKWRYKEQQQLGQIDFLFAEKDEAVETASQLAAAFDHYGVKNLIRADYLYQHYDEKLIHRYLDYLTPANVLWMVMAKSLETDRVSAHYQVPYRLEGLRYERVTLPKTILAKLKLPAVNDFIPRRLDVKAPLALEPQRDNVPRMISEDAGQQVWFKQDNQFHVPRAEVFARIASPAIDNKLQQSVLNDLFIAMVRDSLSSFSYAAQLAGLHFSLSANARGLDLKVGGYNDKQGLLLNRIIHTLTDANFDPERFAAIKQEMLRDSRNSRQQTPYHQLFAMLPTVLYSPQWSSREQIEVLEAIDLNMLKRFAINYWMGARQKVLIHGNVYPQEALQLASVLKSRLHTAAETPPILSTKVTRLAYAEEAPAWSLPVDHNDVAVALYVQGPGITLQDQANILLAAQVLQAPFFDELRTQQQLGYIVFSRPFVIKSVPGLAFIVQSPTADAEHIKQAIKAMLGSYNVSKEDLEQNKQALVNNLMEPPKNLSEQSDIYWNDLLLGFPEFDQREQLTTSVKSLDADSFNQFFERYIKVKPRAIWFSLQKDGAEPEADALRRIQMFKRSSPAYEFQ